jgi:hypothetical protein
VRRGTPRTAGGTPTLPKARRSTSHAPGFWTRIESRQPAPTGPAAASSAGNTPRMAAHAPRPPHGR